MSIFNELLADAFTFSPPNLPIETNCWLLLPSTDLPRATNFLWFKYNLKSRLQPVSELKNGTCISATANSFGPHSFLSLDHRP